MGTRTLPGAKTTTPRHTTKRADDQDILVRPARPLVRPSSAPPVRLPPPVIDTTTRRPFAKPTPNKSATFDLPLVPSSSTTGTPSADPIGKPVNDLFTFHHSPDRLRPRKKQRANSTITTTTMNDGGATTTATAVESAVATRRAELAKLRERLRGNDVLSLARKNLDEPLVRRRSPSPAGSRNLAVRDASRASSAGRLAGRRDASPRAPPPPPPRRRLSDPPRRPAPPPPPPRPTAPPTPPRPTPLESPPRSARTDAVVVPSLLSSDDTLSSDYSMLVTPPKAGRSASRDVSPLVAVPAPPSVVPASPSAAENPPAAPSSPVAKDVSLTYSHVSTPPATVAPPSTTPPLSLMTVFTPTPPVASPSVVSSPEAPLPLTPPVDPSPPPTPPPPTTTTKTTTDPQLVRAERALCDGAPIDSKKGTLYVMGKYLGDDHEVVSKNSSADPPQEREEDSTRRLVVRLREATDEKAAALADVARLETELEARVRRDARHGAVAALVLRVAARVDKAALRDAWRAWRAETWGEEGVPEETPTRKRALESDLWSAPTTPSLSSVLSPPRAWNDTSVSSASVARRPFPRSPAAAAGAPRRRAVDRVAPAFLEQAFRSAPVEYGSELAEYDARRPWDEGTDWVLPADVYREVADPRTPETLEIRARIAADGSTLVVHGDRCARHIRQGGEEREYGEGSANLGFVCYVDATGAESDYFLDAVFEEALATRSSYCSSLVSAAMVLQTVHTSQNVPQMPPVANETAMSGRPSEPSPPVAFVRPGSLPPADAPFPPTGSTPPATNGTVPPPMGSAYPPFSKDNDARKPPTSNGVTPPPTGSAYPPSLSNGTAPPPTGSGYPPLTNDGTTPPPTTTNGRRPPFSNGPTPPVHEDGSLPNGATPPSSRFDRPPLADESSRSVPPRSRRPPTDGAPSVADDADGGATRTAPPVDDEKTRTSKESATRREKDVPATTHSNDLFFSLVGRTVSLFFSLVWFVLVTVPFKITKWVTILLSVGALIAAAWLMVADDNGAEEMGAYVPGRSWTGPEF